MSFFNLFKAEQPPLIEQAFKDVQVMLSGGQNMFSAATAYLLDNEILEVDLSELDKEVNAREQSLRRAVLEHLSIDPNRELLFSLKLISIVHEAERIGDLAKSLARAAGLAKKPRFGRHVEPLRDIRDRILKMFEGGRAGFIEGDVKAARALMQEHETIKTEVTAYLTALADADDLTPNEAVVYALAARLLSRVSSHLANIASTVATSFDRIRRAPTWGEDEPTRAR